MGEETLQQLSTVFDTIMEALPSNASSQEKILYQKLMDYLLREYQNDISLDTASAALSLSPSYIGLIFRRIEPKGNPLAKSANGFCRIRGAAQKILHDSRNLLKSTSTLSLKAAAMPSTS